jgi:hypothetical protein
MSRPDESGKTRLQVLHEIYVQTGVLSKELINMPKVPGETAHIWEWFCDLSGARTSGMVINPISWADMQGYFFLHRLAPERWEVRALRLVDEAYLLSRLNDSRNAVVKNAKGMRGNR